MHRSWFPPEVHINTGRLCSAGSGCHPVPRRHRSYAALRLPAPVGRGSGFPCRRPTSMRALVLCPVGRRTCVRERACVGDGSPGLRDAGIVEERRGPPRLLGRPLRACRGRTPRRIRAPPRPSAERPLLPSGNSAPWASGKIIVFGAACPTAHTLACLRIAGPVAATVARLATGLAGSALAGRGLHPLDDKPNFMKSSHLQFPLTSLAWSH